MVRDTTPKVDDGDSAADPYSLQLWRQRSDPADDSEDNALILTVDADGVVASVLSGEASGHSLATVLETGNTLTERLPEAAASALTHTIRKALQSRQAHTAKASFGEPLCHYEFIVVPQGPKRALLIARDVTESQSEKQRLADLAFMDTESGLPNRRWLENELESILSRARLRQTRCAVVALDIDGNGSLQDAQGESAVRTLIATTVSRLIRNLRGVNQRDEIDDQRYSALAKIGDTRFAAVLPDIESGSDARTVAERLSSQLTEPTLVESREVKLEICSGTSVFPQDGESADEMISSALVALNEARYSTTSAHKLHSGTVRMRAIERQDVLLELDSALKNNEFELNFLPIFPSSSPMPSTAEVLLRWPRPLFATRPIQEVIKAAEYTGIIVSIGEWVLANALRSLKGLHKQGFANLRLAVNLSAREFGRDDLVQCIQQMSEATGIAPAHLDFEITERLLLQDAMRGFSASQRLVDLGVRLVVDDYGTGICSFDSLAGSPIAGIKIHQRFTAAIAHDDSSISACAAMVAMARELGISVTAEGVETQKQADLLTELGCEHLQGFLFCKPMSGAALNAMLKTTAERSV